MQATFDFGTTNTVHFVLEGGVDTGTGRPFLRPLDLQLYGLGDEAQKRPRELKRRINASKAIFDRVTDVDVEQQVPVTTPECVLKRMEPRVAEAIRKSQKANIAAYGISEACTGLLIGMFPAANVKTTSPKAKFFVAGVHMSKIKSKRKTMSNRFVYEFLMRKRNDPDWRWVVEKWVNAEKRDDMSDCIFAAITAIVRRLADMIDMRSVRTKRSGKNKDEEAGETRSKKRKTAPDTQANKN